jgi:deoxyribonuclease-1
MKLIKIFLLIGFPFYLIAEDLSFYQQFILPNYDLSKNFQKGCLIHSKENQNFSEAKKFLKTLYVVNHPISFYCGCKIIYSTTQQRLIPDPNCGYQPKSKNTIYMINWEHVMPAYRFGKSRPCWTNKICVKEKKGKIRRFKGRKCCSMIDDCFAIMEGDLHNLVPTIYELNHDRQNYPYGEIPGEKREYGKCDFEVDPRRKVAEPTESIRGDIARIYLYMSWFYGIPLTEEEKIFITKWNKLDPPSEEEKKLNKLKAIKQGNENPFISYYRYEK